MAAGLAGGIGLSGRTCGALGAAIWILEMNRVKDGTGNVEFNRPEATEAIDRFYKAAPVNSNAPKSSGRSLRISPTTPIICALAAAQK